MCKHVVGNTRYIFRRMGATKVSNSKSDFPGYSRSLVSVHSIGHVRLTLVFHFNYVYVFDHFRDVQISSISLASENYSPYIDYCAALFA